MAHLVVPVHLGPFRCSDTHCPVLISRLHLFVLCTRTLTLSLIPGPSPSLCPPSTGGVCVKPLESQGTFRFFLQGAWQLFPWPCQRSYGTQSEGNVDACGRTFLYLQFSLLTAHLVPIIARTRLWPLQRFTVGKLAVVAFVGTRRPLRSFEVFEDGQTTLLTPVLVFPRFSLRLACGKPQVISVRNISSVCVCVRVQTM